jgi:TPR repeat protein
MLTKLLTLLLFTILSGCKSTKPTNLDQSLQEYRNGQWLLSEMWAKKAIENDENVGQSQYMMGLCEFKRHHLDEAKMWFIQAANSSNKEAQGKATAMLGIISTNKGDHVAAEAEFAKAANFLQGEDRLEAVSRLSPEFESSVISNQTFTLQFGAYRDKSNATSAVTSLSPFLERAGIHSVWISEEKDRSGRTMYLVQAGHFSSRALASTVRNQGNLPQCIVTVAD